MDLHSIISAAGVSTLLYITIKAISLFRIYTRPTSLPRYLRQDSYALITGASDGIGLGFAQELLSRGFNVILHGRNPAKLAAIQTSLQSTFPDRKVDTVIAYTSDNQSDISGIIKSISTKEVTVLVNNVGGVFTVPKVMPLIESTAADIDKIINLNARFQTQLT